ncbi:MAG: UDP-N-acetylglucosamine 2-epimerase [Patescibacteria group bacterium]
MSSKRKILVPIFNRAHYGRLRPVLSAIKRHPGLDLKIIVGVPAAYGGFFNNLLNSRPRSWAVALPWYVLARLRSLAGRGHVLRNDFFSGHLSRDGFRIDAEVPMFLDGGRSETMAKSVGLGIVRLVDELKRLKPDVVFVNADRFEMMAVAIAASYLNIPVAHNEGGDISGTIDESGRHAITKLAHIHFTSTLSSRRRVIQMGEDPEKVFAVGSPAIDAVCGVDFSKPPTAIPGFDALQPYLLVLAHPVATRTRDENVKAAENLIDALKGLSVPKIILGSNIDAGSDVLGGVIRNWLDKEKPKGVYFTKHLHPDDFYKHLKNAACAVGNSSSFIREGAYLGTPAVLVGSRQNKRERSENVVEVPGDKDSLTAAVLRQISHGKFESSTVFGDGGTSSKIANILATVGLDIQKSFYDL